MRILSFSSVRARLILLVFLVLVPILILTGFNAREQRRRAVEQATEQAEVIFNFAVINEQKNRIETEEILARLEEVPAVAKGGEEECSSYLSSLLTNLPQYINFGLAQLDGEVVCSAVPFKRPLNIADRLYFQRALETSSFSVGQYQRGRITGKPSINFGYPVYDRNGKESGVIFAAMDLSYVAEFEFNVTAQIPEGSTYVKLDSNGLVLSSYPASQHFRAGDTVEKSFFEKISKEKKGTFTEMGTDGVERMNMFSTVWGSSPGEESYVLLGIPVKALFAESERSLSLNLVILAIVTAITILVMWFAGEKRIVRPVRVLVDVSKRLAAGDLTARAGLPMTLGELGQLSRSFDDMAGELERRKEALRESNERFQNAFEDASIGMALVAIDGQWLRVNRALCDLLGSSEKELLTKTIQDIAYPDDREADLAYVQQMLAGEIQTYRMEKRYIHKAGHVVWVLLSVSLVRDNERNPMYFISQFQDITERKQAEETTFRMARAIEQSTDMIVITDTGGRIEYVNPSFERTTGYSRDEAIGHNPRILKSGKQNEGFYKKLWETITSGETFKGTMTNRRKDGSFYEEEATISPVFDSSGKIINFVAIKRDMTRERELQKQVQTAQRMEAVGTLAGGIAHDFNNALTGIFGFGEILRSQLAGNEAALANLEQILRCGERAATLTRQLLTYSRRQIINPINLSLNTVVTDLLKLIMKVLGEHIEIRTFLKKELPIIRADVGQIEQVIMNLIVNARDAMPSGGRLTIETELANLDDDYVRSHPYMRVGSYVLLTVSDTGVGMDAKTRERVFEPFFTTKTPEKGTGLGLSVVYGIVKQHNGFIHLYSEPGKGTAFKIYFPPAEGVPDVVKPAKPSEIHGGTETILLAEDDESVRILGERTLRDLGYTVLVTLNGEDAIETFHRNKEKISLAVLDVVMPLKGGKEAYEAMHETVPDLKVIFMSGYTGTSLHESFVRITGVPFLTKPFGPGALARKVREVLDKA
jgi:PAS domain S-box-containing protein